MLLLLLLLLRTGHGLKEALEQVLEQQLVLPGRQVGTFRGDNEYGNVRLPYGQYLQFRWCKGRQGERLGLGGWGAQDVRGRSSLWCVLLYVLLLLLLLYVLLWFHHDGWRRQGCHVRSCNG